MKHEVNNAGWYRSVPNGHTEYLCTCGKYHTKWYFDSQNTYAGNNNDYQKNIKL